MKMKAAVLEEFNQPLVMEERELRSLKSAEVVVRIKASGVCGSDVHMWKGKDPRTPLPIILGHEGVKSGRGDKGKMSSDTIFYEVRGHELLRIIPQKEFLCFYIHLEKYLLEYSSNRLKEIASQE